MKCMNIRSSWIDSCLQFHKAFAAFHPNKRYMIQTNDSVNTNIQDQNPYKCHYTELWENVISNQAIYNIYWSNLDKKQERLLYWNNTYTIATVDWSAQMDFSCEQGMNSIFQRLWFVPLTKQELIHPRALYINNVWNETALLDLLLSDLLSMLSEKTTKTTVQPSWYFNEFKNETYRLDWKDIEDKFLFPHIVKAVIPPIPKPLRE